LGLTRSAGFAGWANMNRKSPKLFIGVSPQLNKKITQLA
jgi:hypothetical protein